MDYESVGIGEPAMSTQAPSRQDEHRTELYGVRGWLLVLCIYLAIVMPLIAILGAVGALQLAIRAPDLRVALLSVAVIEILLASFAAYAGLALYRTRANAVKIAKAYFITIIVLSILGWGMLATAQTQSAGPFKGLGITIAVSWPAILSVAWLVYLQRSKRVRANFPKT
jgi:hypothetical protein